MGDLKWRNIARVSDRRFSFEDLVRQSGSGAMSYVPGFIDAQPNGTELRLSFPTTGTFQEWQQPHQGVSDPGADSSRPPSAATRPSGWYP